MLCRTLPLAGCDDPGYGADGFFAKRTGWRGGLAAKQQARQTIVLINNAMLECGNIPAMAEGEIC